MHTDRQTQIHTHTHTHTHTHITCKSSKYWLSVKHLHTQYSNRECKQTFEWTAQFSDIINMSWGKEIKTEKGGVEYPSPRIGILSLRITVSYQNKFTLYGSSDTEFITCSNSLDFPQENKKWHMNFSVWTFFGTKTKKIGLTLGSDTVMKYGKETKRKIGNKL